MDTTQLSKITCSTTLRADGPTCMSPAFTSVTPPPSPRETPTKAHDHDEHARPPHSYVRLVILALLECEDNQGTIKEIYEQITKKFPYYRENRLHWKNSVRHNLTVFRCFQRIAGADGETSRGSYRWKLTGDWQTTLMKAEALQARRKTFDRETVADDECLKQKGKRDKSKSQARKERENAKRRKRDRARRLKLRSAAASRMIQRLPLAERNSFGVETLEKIDAPLPSRMPTPPPRLPGIENIFLPAPVINVTPKKKCTSSIWIGSPGIDISVGPIFAHEEEPVFQDSNPIDKFWSVSENDIDHKTQSEMPYGGVVNSRMLDHHDAGLGQWSSECKSSRFPSSSFNEVSFWDPKEPEFDILMELMTVDPDWMSITEEDFLIGLSV
ncbi:uncharacterized protein [Diadema antillarum]|uniref:uncharacterized protein n=1 Tax=Diadema antillarum TaxID=105358 RepID=UPI003A8559FE